MELSQSIKKRFLVFIKIFFSAAILYFLIRSALLNVNLLSSVFSHPIYLISAVSLFLLMVTINAWRWYRLNSAQGISLSFKKTWMPTYLGTAFNNILPGAVGGDFVRLYYLFKKIPDKKSGALLSILFDRISGLMGIFVLLCAIAFFNLNFFTQSSYLYYLLFSCVVACLMGLCCFFMSLLLPQRIGLSGWLEKKFPNSRWIKPLLSFLEAVRIYRNAKKVIFECLFFSVMIQLIMVLTIMIIAKMMNFAHISFLDYAFAIGVTQIVNLVPATPGGIGLGEMAFAKIILMLNTHKAGAYATIFLAYRLIGILSYLPGIFYYLFKASDHDKKNDYLIASHAE